MRNFKLLLSVLFLALALLCSVYFEEVLYFFAGKMGLGWVFSTFYIRVLVIIFLALFLIFLFSIFEKLQKVKKWILILIAIVPGFFLTFATFPIYNTDYGSYSDDFKAPPVEQLSTLTNNSYKFNNNYNLVAFYTTTCPHCKASCNKLAMNKQAGQKVKVDIFFPGTLEDSQRFIDENNGKEFDFHLSNNMDNFINYSGGAFPSLFLLDPSGNTIKHWTGDKLNYTSLDYLLSLE